MTKLQNHDNLIKSASYLSVAVALIMVCAKTYGWIMTNSQSVLASLIDSSLDISSSLLNTIAVRFALQPPDNNHRFGYEKFQDLAIFSQSIFFFASSLFAIFAVTKSVFEHKPLYNQELGLNIMLWCVGIAVLLVVYQSYVVRITNSRIIVADRLHFFSDLLSNFVVIICMLVGKEFWFIDPIVAIGISLYVMYMSYELFKSAVKNLVDQELEQKDKDEIVSIIYKNPMVKGVHDLKTRYAANKPFIQFHIEMDSNISLLDAHKVSEEILSRLLDVFPLADITIHQDPEGVEEHVDYREPIPKL